MTLRLYQVLKTLVNFTLSIVTFLLVTRLVLRFFSTNPTTPFVQWVFNMSNVLMSPFANIVPNITTHTGVLDIVAIITLLAYSVMGYVILSLLDSVVGTKVAVEDYSTAEHYHEIRPKKQVRYERKEDYDL